MSTNGGPKRKRDTYIGAPNNKRAIMSAMHSMTSLNLPPGIEHGNVNGYPRKNNKSNNRREWMKECLKLLETMMELEDSKPFREPVDCLKYPDFYTLVGDPIDLSKVMLKFRGGQYQDPFDFEKDVKQLFDDYKAFFKDPKTEIYVQTQNLSTWFDFEFGEILKKYGDKLKRRPELVPPVVMTTDASANTAPALNTNIMVSINNGSCTILQSPERQVQAPISDPTSHWSQVMSSKNFRVIQQQVITQPSITSTGRPSSPYYSNNNNTHPQHLPFSAAYTPENTPPHNRWPSGEQPLPIVNNTNSPKQFENKSSEMSMTRVFNREVVNGCDLTPPHLNNLRDHSPDFAHSHIADRYSGHHHNHLSFSDRSFSQHSDPGIYSRRDRSFDAHSPSSLRLNDSPQQMHESRDCSPANHQANSLPASTKKTAAMHANAHVGTTLVGMKLDVSNIFFGKIRCKPTQPIIIHENGLKIPVMHKDKGTNITFKIKVDEIVRVSAHLGRNKKHTLFIFVTPNFIQHLEDALSEQDSKASLIAFFMPALSVSQIGRLLHVFHNMSKHSMFGNLFNEIDQKGALSLLANIKPGIINRVAEKVRGKNTSLNSSPGATTSSLSSQRNPMGRSSSLPTSSSPPAPTPARAGSLDKGGGRDQGTALDLTVPFARAAIAERPHQPENDSNLLQVVPNCRTYKPKFHFRSHSSHGALMKQGSTNSEPGILYTTSSKSLDIEIGNTSSPSLNREQELDYSSNSLLRSSIANNRQENERRDESNNKKNECIMIDSDLELDFEPDEEELSSSHHSVLLFNDSSAEDLTIVDPEEDECMISANDGMMSEGDVVMTEQKLSLRCPITQQVMKYPLKNKHCGHCYDREGVIQLIKNRGNKARCAVAGCSNDRALIMGDLLFESDLYHQVVNKLGHFQVK